MTAAFFLKLTITSVFLLLLSGLVVKKVKPEDIGPWLTLLVVSVFFGSLAGAVIGVLGAIWAPAELTC